MIHAWVYHENNNGVYAIHHHPHRQSAKIEQSTDPKARRIEESPSL